jgi:hypothetical protein
LAQAQDATLTLLKTFEDEWGRPKRVQLGEFRNELEDFVFKMCSKLVHPTSFSILLLPTFSEAQLETRRAHFLSLALYYAKVGLDALLAVPSFLRYTYATRQAFCLQAFSQCCRAYPSPVELDQSGFLRRPFASTPARLRIAVASLRASRQGGRKWLSIFYGTG